MHSILTLNHRSEFETSFPWTVFRHVDPSTSRTMSHLSTLPITLKVFMLILQLFHTSAAHTRVSNSSYLFVSRNSWNIHFDNHVNKPTALYSWVITISSSNNNRPTRTALARLDHRYLRPTLYFLIAIPFFLLFTSTFSWCVQILIVAIFLTVMITAHQR
jgi:hypothetical protein